MLYRYVGVIDCCAALAGVLSSTVWDRGTQHCETTPSTKTSLIIRCRRCHLIDWSTACDRHHCLDRSHWADWPRSMVVSWVIYSVLRDCSRRTRSRYEQHTWATGDDTQRSSGQLVVRVETLRVTASTDHWPLSTEHWPAVSVWDATDRQTASTHCVLW